jgi:hypothetical protein
VAPHTAVPARPLALLLARLRIAQPVLLLALILIVVACRRSTTNRCKSGNINEIKKVAAGIIVNEGSIARCRLWPLVTIVILLLLQQKLEESVVCDLVGCVFDLVDAFLFAQTEGRAPTFGSPSRLRCHTNGVICKGSSKSGLAFQKRNRRLLSRPLMRSGL